MRAIGDEARQTFFQFGNGVGGYDAEGLEALVARLRFDRRAQRQRVGQKSRSA
jgi:hypothetical protein